MNRHTVEGGRGCYTLTRALLSLGIWYNILSGMGKFSVIINVSINAVFIFYCLTESVMKALITVFHFMTSV